MCKLDEFWPRIKRIPLIIGPDLGTEAILCHTLDGQTAVRVTKPEYFKTDLDREAHVIILESFYKTSCH